MPKTKIKAKKPTAKTKGEAELFKVPPFKPLPRREVARIHAEARDFVRRAGGQAQLIPLLGTSDTMLTSEELDDLDGTCNQKPS